MQIAAELIEGAIGRGDLKSVVKNSAAFAAYSSSDLGRIDIAIPGNPAITVFIKPGRIDWTDRLTGARMPVLTVGPMVGQNKDRADPAKRQLILVRCRIPPLAPVTLVKPTVPAIVRSTVWHCSKFPIAIEFGRD